MNALHIVQGGIDNGDKQWLEVAAKKPSKAMDWTTPKSAVIGDDVVIFIGGIGFFATAKVMSTPKPGRGRAGRYSARVASVRLIDPPISLPAIIQAIPNLTWTSYPRSYTTPSVEISRRIRKLIAVRPRAATLPHANVKATAVPDESGLDRTDPGAAAEVISQILGDDASAQRLSALRFLVDSVRWAALHGNDRWGVTLWPDLVRFNVGFVHCVNLGARGMTVLVHRNPQVAGVKLERYPYSTAADSRLAAVPYGDARRVLPLLRKQHIAAMTAAARRRPTPQIRGAHSPGVVDYLWAELGYKGNPPTPSYFDEETQQRYSIEAQHAVMALPDMGTTEKMAVIKSRLAQRLFRSRLAAADCRCRVTGVTQRYLLRASHIRPWAKSDDRQRQDPNNGLLLAPHVDMLFDAGYLTFEDDGTVRFSNRVQREVLKAWGLSGTKKVAAFTSEQAVYLAYHRKHVFKGIPQ